MPSTLLSRYAARAVGESAHRAIYHAHSFLVNDFKRASNKYTKANTNFKANHVNSTLRKRQADVFMRAQSLERQSLATKRDGSKRAAAHRKRNKVVKRASSGQIGLTDYFSGGQDAAYYGSIGIGSPTQTFGEHATCVACVRTGQTKG